MSQGSRSKARLGRRSRRRFQCRCGDPHAGGLGKARGPGKRAVFGRVALSVRVLAAAALAASVLVVAAGPALAQTQTDFDVDDDGLIEVSSLAQLDVMRWDLDGDGSVDRGSFESSYTTAFADAITGMGCPSTGCSGYELSASLDFDTNGSGTANAGDDFWNGGSGWEPIGTSIDAFSAAFDGNLNTVSNLFVDRAIDNVGLFGYLDSAAIVRNVGLAGVHVESRGRFVGALVGHSSGARVAGSSSAGSVKGHRGVGGLVGKNLGGAVVSSASAAAVVGDSYVGGLVGSNSVGGSLRAVYATGTVDGTSHVGGLVGWHSGSGSVEAAYAIGAVRGTSHKGGLIGRIVEGGSVVSSYWNTQTSGQSTSAGGTGHTTTDLTTPTDYSGIYANWNIDLNSDSNTDDPWNFGTNTEYPDLRTLTQTDFDVDDDGLIEVSSLAQLDVMRWDLDGDGSVDRGSFESSYTTAFADAITGMGCPSTGCSGYELSASLDFDTNGSGTANAGDDFWNGGSGWEPIGTSIDAFSAAFDGNLNTVSNLFVDRAIDNVGLFGYLDSAAIVRNVGLAGVHVESRGRFVGALVGHSSGARVAGSSSAGSVKGHRGVGGLVGKNLGGAVVSSASAAAVVGDSYVGGLVGSNSVGGSLRAVYATGTVDGTSHVGGLVGWHSGSGSVEAAYAIGAVRGTSHKGGLIGRIVEGGSVVSSYWNTQTSGQSTSAGGTGHTTTDLTTPTDYSGIYANWNIDLNSDSNTDDPWNFGTNTEYPDLRTLVSLPTEVPIVDEIAVMLSQLSLEVGEGESESYTVVLGSEPAGDVVVAITSSNSDVTDGDGDGGFCRRHRGGRDGLRPGAGLRAGDSGRRGPRDGDVYLDADERRVRGGLRDDHGARQRGRGDGRGSRTDPQGRRHCVDIGGAVGRAGVCLGGFRGHGGGSDGGVERRRATGSDDGHGFRGSRGGFGGVGNRLRGGFGLHADDPGGGTAGTGLVHADADRRWDRRRRRDDHGGGRRERAQCGVGDPGA